MIDANHLDPTDPRSEKILWVDVETTGLVAREERLLQVAALVTDVQGNLLSDEFCEVVYQGDAQQLRESANDVVRNMHDQTGLWNKLGQGLAVDIVDALLLDFVKEHAPEPRQARLGGNSVALDMDFAREYLPLTHSHLHYRVIDVSSLAYALDSWGVTGGYFEKKKTHDALDDIRESLEEYKWLQNRVLNR